MSIEKSRVLSRVKPIRLLLDGVKQEIFSRDGKPKIPLTMLTALNRKLWGLREGLTVIGARTSNGKSAFAMQIAYDLAKQQIPVLFLSLEMSVEVLIERLFCLSKTIRNYDLLCGMIREDEYMMGLWDAFDKEIREYPLLITEGIGKTYEELIMLYEMLEPKPKCIIIDYIQMIRNADEREGLSNFIRRFREYCVKNKIVGIICSQVNRGVLNSGNEPSMEYLKGTGSLEENCDVCLLLFWKYNYSQNDEDKNKFEVIIAKNRNGATGYHEVFFNPEYYLFCEMYKEDKV